MSMCSCLMCSRPSSVVSCVCVGDVHDRSGCVSKNCPYPWVELACYRGI
ncbi:hypothetical protein M6B38_107005 [Iris pallida]|uniref:Uncharacterized protein n=1 Tax=Iris pallida TaxID=29817 RepID=A0AAX6ESF8_IRIPA|nr:hypothetical protein M6B38_107005 [Iris pallida]